MKLKFDVWQVTKVGDEVQVECTVNADGDTGGGANITFRFKPDDKANPIDKLKALVGKKLEHTLKA